MSDQTPGKQDGARVDAQLDVTDAGSCSGGSRTGRTNFEARRLNEMLDLIESANPEDLESAGTALWKARDGLKDAGRELKDYVTSVEWKGEAATEFRRFGLSLATHAGLLGDFADAAGTQITVAGTGLASVRSSKPDRDGRFVQKRPEDFELPERTQDNADYQKAVKVEKDRQEAINQMNRLSSFYAVSEETLAAQKPPTFPEMLKADVPQPAAGWRPPASTTGMDTVGADPAGAASSQSTPGHADAGGTRGVSRAEGFGAVTPDPGRNTSMEIDSVMTPQAPTTSPGPASAPPPTTAGGPPGGQQPHMANTFLNPGHGGTSRPSSASGRSGSPGVGTPGRSKATGTGPSTGGRAGATGTTGRPGAMGGGAAASGRAGASGGAGQAPAAGRSPMGSGAAASGRAGGASGAAGGQSSTAGRPGTAGQPTAGRAGAGGASGPRAGRGDGIAGGTQQRAAPGTAGSRIPRGTVIGAEATTPGRSGAAQPRQSGVIGATPANRAPTGRGTPSSNGVVGAPRSGVPGSRSGGGGFTAGGTGLAGGRPGQQRPRDEEQERTGSVRPDYLTEDEETWAARRRGSVPPVID